MLFRSIRALLNSLSGEGLRLVQVDRHDLSALPMLVEQQIGRASCRERVFPVV